MEKIIKINSEKEMIKLGYLIGNELSSNMVVTLNGDLGAGKTTLTKGIGRALKVGSVVNSPTYTILKIHEGDLRLYHMDTYRISEDSGDDYLEEFFEMGGVSVIEWSDNIKYLLPSEVLRVDILDLGGTNREVKLSSNDKSYIKIIESVKI